MKFKSLMLLAVAVGCGLVAMLGVQQALSNKAKPAAQPDMTSVYVAAQEIPPGVFLDETMLKTEKWPKSAVPAGAITDPSQFAERALIIKAVPGDLILQAKLGEKGKSGASVSIPKGMRVVTVPVNLTQAHSGLMQPGDRVDVLVTYKTRDDQRGTIQKTKTVLEYIQVFATDKLRNAEGAADNSGKTSVKNISLLVTPEQGNLLMLAVSKGTLQLALRHQDDRAAVHTAAVDERSFDGAMASVGLSDEDSEAALLSATEPGQADEDANLRDFLDDTADADKPATADAAPAAPPEKILWTITIFEKDSKREEQVELPNPELGKAPVSTLNPTDEGVPQSDAASQPPAGKSAA